MMDPIAKEVWCEALRSGEFRQTQNNLKWDGGYCCLGVAREIFPWLERDDEMEYLSASACRLLGISSKRQRTLGRMNDQGKSFDQIAHYIETAL